MVRAFTQWEGGRRGPAETLRELGRRLPLTRQEADALALVEAECYAPAGLSPTEVAVAIGVLNARGRRSSGASRASGGGRSRRPW